jgi:hypothetical protein
MNRSFLVPLIRICIEVFSRISLSSCGRKAVIFALRTLGVINKNQKIEPYEPRLWNEFYVTVSFAFQVYNLVVLLPQLIATENRGFRLYFLAIFVPIYRILEILKTTAAIIVVDRELQFFSEEGENKKIGSYYTLVGYLNSWLIMIVIKWFDMIVCFSVLAFFFGDEWSTKIKKPLDALYATMITMMTLGYGDYYPVDESTKMLVISELFCFVAYVLLILPVVAGSFKTREIKRH